MSVIGCVWGAHRRLAERWGGEFPDYAWCEREWERLRKTAPSGNGLPGWLEQELWAAWRRELAEGRPERYTQARLFA